MATSAVETQKFDIAPSQLEELHKLQSDTEIPTQIVVRTFSGHADMIRVRENELNFPLEYSLLGMTNEELHAYLLANDDRVEELFTHGVDLVKQVTAKIVSVAKREASEQFRTTSSEAADGGGASVVDDSPEAEEELQRKINEAMRPKIEAAMVATWASEGREGLLHRGDSLAQAQGAVDDGANSFRFKCLTHYWKSALADEIPQRLTSDFIDIIKEPMKSIPFDKDSTSNRREIIVTTFNIESHTVTKTTIPSNMTHRAAT